MTPRRCPSSSRCTTRRRCCPCSSRGCGRCWTALGETYEVVAVDDGSRTRPPVAADAACGATGRSCGWSGCGATAATRRRSPPACTGPAGDYVVSIDADLQDPPEKIAEMLELARERGLDIVYGVRDDRSTDTSSSGTPRGSYYRLMRRMVGKQVPARRRRLPADEPGHGRRAARAAGAAAGLPAARAVAGLPQRRGDLPPRRAGGRQHQVPADAR